MIKAVFVRPTRMDRIMSRLTVEFDLVDTPEPIRTLKDVMEKEFDKPANEMNAVILELAELLMELLSSYGMSIDFFSVVGIEPADEGKSLLIRVL